MDTCEARLFEHYRASCDPACREALVTRYLPLARSLARRYDCGGEPFDDLFQVASFALLKAIDRYDPTRGTAFSSYAVPTIVGELKRHYRDTTWTLRIPHSVHDLAMKLRKTRDWLASVNGRQPMVAELAEASGASEEAVLEALGALTANEVISLQTPSNDDSERTLADELGGTDAGYSRVEQQALLEDLCRCLTPREQRVVALRFNEGLTQGEIGKRVGVSQMTVSRVLRAALPRLGESAERDVRAG